ncbi:MAG: hypothetical protein H6Q48_638, partial [Deltaproteobacteria bacterium]|nr:hypothetical protein [Deltaproteobacteria bacterium]
MGHFKISPKAGSIQVKFEILILVLRNMQSPISGQSTQQTIQKFAYGLSGKNTAGRDSPWVYMHWHKCHKLEIIIFK